MPKAYWLGIYRELKDQEKQDAYAALAVPALKEAGGRILARGGKVTAWEAGVPERTVVIEFDSYEQAVAAYDSPGYQAALMVLGDGAIRDMRVVEAVE